jgi:hypothetical protein
MKQDKHIVLDAAIRGAVVVWPPRQHEALLHVTPIYASAAATLHQSQLRQLGYTESSRYGIQ